MKLNALKLALEELKVQDALSSEDVVQMNTMLGNINSRVKDNTEIVTPESLGCDFLMHVSTDTNIRRFVPEVSKRGSDSENRMLGRVHVCPTLLGCFIGYAATAHDFLNYASTGSRDEKNYKGGFKVYGLPFKAALRPNGRMVYDANMSDEHWLVSYSPETSEYIPFMAAKCFYSAVTHVGRTGKLPTMHGLLYVEVVHPDGIAFSKKIHLDKGFWRIEGPMPENTKSFETDKGFTVKEIDKGEYFGVKNQTAALLNFE